MSDMLTFLSSAIGATYGNFIGGEWQPNGDRTSEITNPADRSQVLGRFNDSGAAEVDAAVTAAHEAWLSWRLMPGPDRGAILFRAADLLEQRVDELSFILSAEQGKVLAEARGEVGRAAKELRFSAGEASRIDGDVMPSEKRNGLAMTFREPIGVIAAIGPWNFPVVTPVRKIGPALAFGCAVVLKPSNLTPWSAVKLMDVFRDAGVPAGVVSLVLGSGRAVGDALVNHPLVRGISFTGSTGTGLAINAAAGRRLVRTQLELGGKNPVDGPVGQQITDGIREQSGYEVVAYWLRGPRWLTTKVTIEKPEDLSGLKIRVPDSPVTVQSWNQLGASATPMNFGEVFNALQQGVIDGQENPLSLILSSKFSEVVKYLVRTEHAYEPVVVVMDAGRLAGMPEDQRKAIVDAANGAAKTYSSEEVLKGEQVFVKALQDAGMTLVEPDKKSFQDRVNSEFVHKTFAPVADLYDSVSAVETTSGQ